MTSEELDEILNRVEEAKSFGHGVGTLALGDVPKLVAEVKKMREKLDEAESLLTESQLLMNRVNCYDTDVYHEITEYFERAIANG